jgi:hypothetical protein
MLLPRTIVSEWAITTIRVHPRIQGVCRRRRQVQSMLPDCSFLLFLVTVTQMSMKWCGIRVNTGMLSVASFYVLLVRFEDQTRADVCLSNIH